MQGYLAPELKASIRKAFLDLNDKEILKTFRAERFMATDDHAYDILRETAKVARSRSCEVQRMNLPLSSDL